MKLMVVSDSHSSRSFMLECARVLKPDGIIHLGDYYEDGEVLHEAYPTPIFYQVGGNCDRWRMPPFAREIAIETIGGVTVYMTHGHLQRVKNGLGLLEDAGMASKAQLVLFGHTHQATIQECDGGMILMNPGAAGSYGGSVGLVEIADRRVQRCRILRGRDLEEWL